MLIQDSDPMITPFVQLHRPVQKQTQAICEIRVIDRDILRQAALGIQLQV